MKNLKDYKISCTIFKTVFFIFYASGLVSSILNKKFFTLSASDIITYIIACLIMAFMLFIPALIIEFLYKKFKYGVSGQVYNENELENKPAEENDGKKRIFKIIFWLFLWPFYPVYLSYLVFRNPVNSKKQKIIFIGIVCVVYIFIGSLLPIAPVETVPAGGNGASGVVETTVSPSPSPTPSPSPVPSPSPSPVPSPSPSPSPTPSPSPSPSPIPSSTPAETVTQPADNNNVTQSVIVYITASGKKYHSNPNCSNMKNPIAVTLEEAQKTRTPCSKCY